MTSGLGVTDYGVITLMLVLSAAIGLYFQFTGGRQKTTNEYLMAGKNMTVLPVAFSLTATFLSAISMMAISSDVYLYGTQFLSLVVGIPIGSVLASYMFLPVFFEMQTKTTYEYLEKRFGKTTRIIASLLFIFQTLLLMAVILYAPALALNAVTGLSTWGSIFALAGVCTFYSALVSSSTVYTIGTVPFYSSLGGLKAVLWSDVLQAILMFIALISVVIKGTIDIGGFRRILDIASDGSRLQFFNFNFNLEERYTFWGAMFTGVFAIFSNCGSNQVQVQRLLSIPSLKRARRSLYISTPLIMIFESLCVLSGVIIFAFYHNCDPILKLGNTISSAEQLLPSMAQTLFSNIPGLTGLCIAGIFSASLSTMSSAMNSLAAVTIEDFIRPSAFGKRLTEAWTTFLAKLIALAYGGISLLLVFVVANFRGIMEAIFVVYGLMSAPIQGVFTLGVLTTTANEPGTLLGFLVGLLLNGWMSYGSYTAKMKFPQLPRSIEGCAKEFVESSNNGTALYDAHIIQNSIVSNYTDLNKDVFPLYKISFAWHPSLSMLAVIIFGYICSYIVGHFQEQKTVTPELICPMLRKWFFKRSDNAKATHEFQLLRVTEEGSARADTNGIDCADGECSNTLI